MWMSEGLRPPGWLVLLLYPFLTGSQTGQAALSRLPGLEVDELNWNLTVEEPVLCPRWGCFTRPLSSGGTKEASVRGAVSAENPSSSQRISCLISVFPLVQGSVEQVGTSTIGVDPIQTVHTPSLV